MFLSDRFCVIDTGDVTIEGDHKREQRSIDMLRLTGVEVIRVERT